MLDEPPLVLDTDFLSCFAWAKRLDILEKLFPAKMIILEQVLTEISRVSSLSTQVQQCIKKGTILPLVIYADAPEAIELARYLEEGRYGQGESACMAYLKHNVGTMGSNNLRDVAEFCSVNHKKLLCTDECLCFALESKVLNIRQCESIWQLMLAKRNTLPTATFSEFYSKYRPQAS
jgi:hypothetical protein